MSRDPAYGVDSSPSDWATRVQRQLAVAQQITHIGSWEWDLETKVVTWSDELYRIYGLAPRSCEITLESFLARLHPEDRGRVAKQVEEALVRGGRFAYPERIVRPDGTVRELDTIGEVVRDDAGQTRGLIGTCRDVTEERARDETIQIFGEIVRYVQIALSVWEVPDPDDIGSVRLVAYNPAAEAAARRSLTSALGEAFLDLFPYAVDGQTQALLTDVARDGQVREALVQRSRDPRDPGRALALKAFPLPGKRVGLAAEDVTEQTRARRLKDAEQRILEMIAAGAPLREILTNVVFAVEAHAPPAIASILLLDSDGKRVRHGAAPHLPDAYNRAIDGFLIGPNAGSCGTAAYLRKPVIVTDIETDPLWAPYRDIARPHGLRACWSTPILATDGRVLGTFALYYREPRAPDDKDLALIARATHVAGIAIERRQLEDQLRALSARVESVREEERTGIAREIHDELGQVLTALKMDVAWIARRLAGKGDVPRDAIAEKLTAMSQMTDDVIQQVRRISAELRPGVLDDLGLLAAIEWQAQEFEKRTGTACAIHSDLEEKKLERGLATAVFRIFQEALTNIARHADAKRVDVHLACADGMLHLEVTDDGKGITPDAIRNPRSLGLLGIRERARQLGGTATIGPAAGKGTVVSLAIPVVRAEEGGAP